MYKYLQKIKPKHYPWLAFFLTCITYLTAFSYMGLLSNGKYIIARSDLLQQYIPFIYMLGDVISGEKSFWFSWNVNMGGSTALLHAYYTLSPFNIIFFLLGEAGVMRACAIVIVLKAGLSAVTFQMLMTKAFGQKGIRTVLFAMMYALCGFQVSYYFVLSWMDAQYMFPVIILCIVNLVKNGKKLGLIASYAYLFFINFYMGYIAGMCSFFLFIAYAMYIYGKGNIRIFIKSFCDFLFCVLAAIALTCIIWYPAVLEIFNNPPLYGSVFQTTYCNPLFIYNNLFMGQMQSLEGVTPFIYCGIPVLLLLPCYFSNKRISKRERIYAAMVILWFMLCILVLPVNRIMHAFDDPNMFRYRYAYCFTFVLVVIAGRQSMFMKSISKKTIGIIVAADVVIYIVTAFLYKNVFVRDFNANTLFGFIVNFSFIGIWIISVWQYRKRNLDDIAFYTLAVFLLMAELGLNTGMILKNMEHEAMLEDAYEAWHDLTKDTVERIKAEDEGWYRILFSHVLSKNTGAWFETNEIGSFSSAAGSSSYQRGMKSLGFYATDVARSHAGITPVTELLLGIKYKADLARTQSYIQDSGSKALEVPFQRADKYLNAGYMVAEEIKNYRSEESPFENQNRLLSAMTGESIECFRNIDKVEVKIDNGEFLQTENSIILLRNEIETESVFHFSVPDNEANCYVYFAQPESKYQTGNAEMKTNLEENENVAVEFKLYPQRIVKLGMKEKRYAIDVILEEDTEAVQLTEAYFVNYDRSELDKAFRILRENQFEKIVPGKNSLSGEVTAERKKSILFTTIPYTEGWKVSVDGKEKAVIPLAEETFIGVELEQGKHHVEFIYEAPGVKEGAVVTSGTALLLMIWIWRVIPLSNKNEKRRRRKNEKTSKETGKETETNR